MISEDKNSLESKVVLAIKTVFEDLTKRMVNSTLETDFSRQTTSLHYIFKKDGSYEIIDFVGGFIMFLITWYIFPKFIKSVKK